MSADKYFSCFQGSGEGKEQFQNLVGWGQPEQESSSDIGFVLESFNGVGNQVGLTSGRKLYVDKNRGNVSYVDDTLVVAPFFVDTLLEITNITMTKQQWI